MPANVVLPTGKPYDVVLEEHDGDRVNTLSADGMTLRNVSVVSDGGGGARYKLLFSRVAWSPTPVKPNPLDSMVHIKDQLPGHYGLLMDRWSDMTVRRLALKLAETIKVVPEMCNFRAEDKRDYGVMPIAKVSEEKEIRGVHIPKRGGTESKLETKLVTAKRFYFRNRWYNNPGGEELSFRCSSYKALLGKDLSEMLEERPYKAIVRMVLPKSEGSPLGAVLVEFIKNK